MLQNLIPGEPARPGIFSNPVPALNDSRLRGNDRMEEVGMTGFDHLSVYPRIIGNNAFFDNFKYFSYMTLSSTQIPLRLNPQQIYHFDNFFFKRKELKQAIKHFDEIDFLYLWGARAAGKTHLLLAAAEQTKQSVYLPLKELVSTVSPAIFESLEHSILLCIDDLDVIASLPEWQESLFHCFNRLQQFGGKLLVSAMDSPVNITLALPDLRSRMATALVYQLELLSDREKQQALQLQAQYRGLELTDDVAAYLLRHYSRDMEILINLLSELDKAAMSAKRRLTLPFIRLFLGKC